MATDSVHHRLHDFDFPPPSRQNTSAYNRTAPVAPQYTYTTHPTVASPDLSHLAHQFSQHTIHYDPRAATTSYSSATPLQYQQTQQPAYYQQPQQHNAYRCPHTSSSTRAQRQANSSLLYQQSHTRQISSLVERMIESGEQCLICSPSPPPPPPDEGLGDMEEDLDDPNVSAHTLGYRRSSDFGSANYVTKSIRVRKQKRPKSDPSRWKQ